jgi:hypothetical protein
MLPKRCPAQEARMKVELTPRSVTTLPVEAGRSRTVYMDTHPDAPQGFAMRVTSNGARSFYLLITHRTKGRRWIRIGNALTLSLDAARKAARVRAGEVALDRDPTQEARDKRALERAERYARTNAVQEWTVVEMVRAYIAARPLKLRTKKGYERFLAHDVEPTEFGAKLARDVVKDDVRNFIADIAVKRPAIADSVFALLGSAYRWAEDEEYLVLGVEGKLVKRRRVDGDPTRGAATVNKKPRTHVLEDAEIAAWWLRLDALKVTRSAFARVLLLVGARSLETYLACWKDVKLEGPNPTWYIPAKNRKGREEGHRGEPEALTIPLSPLAVRVLAELRAVTGARDRVFVGEGISHAMIGGELRFAVCTVDAHRDKAWKAGTKLISNAEHHTKRPADPLACLADTTVHDLRRSVASGLQRLGAPPHVITTVLGHAREAGATRSDASYTHDPRAAEHRAWLERWADHVARLIGEAEPARVVAGEFGKIA